MRDIWRRIVTAMFPTWTGRRAADDGGPGPELSASDSAGAPCPTGDDGADSSGPTGWTSPAADPMADMATAVRHAEHDYLTGRFDREAELAAERRRDTASWQNQAADAFADVHREFERKARDAATG